MHFGDAHRPSPIRVQITRPHHRRDHPMKKLAVAAVLALGLSMGGQVMSTPPPAEATGYISCRATNIATYSGCYTEWGYTTGRGHARWSGFVRCATNTRIRPSHAHLTDAWCAWTNPEARYYP